MDRLTFTGCQRRGLERQLREAKDAALYRRTLALLEVARGRPVAEVAGALRVSRQSIYNWAAAYAAERARAKYGVDEMQAEVTHVICQVANGERA